MEGIYNNDEHTLPQTKECICSDTMKLELKEDTCGNVSYVYICTYSKCNVVEEI
jgi:hypothetical protein